MDYRAVAVVAAAILAVMIAGSAWAVVALPPDALVPIHFGLDGKPDAWARPLFGLFVLPAVATGVLILLIVLARSADGGLARSGVAFRTVILAVIGLLATTHAVMIAIALGHEFNVTRIVILLAGLLLIVTGNVLGKVRPNHWLGIRTAWTLADVQVWDQTHRFAGWLFVIAGALLAIAAVLNPGGGVLAAILLFVVAVVTIAPFAKSYLLWRDRQHI
jgi:immunity protein, SdpI family